MRTLTACWTRVAFVAIVLAAMVLPGVVQPDPAAAARRAACHRIIMPAYFNPGDKWTRMLSSAPAVGIVILNPNSGPDRYLDHWARVTRVAQAKGIKVIGYVATDLGRRSQGAIKGDIDKYFNWYNVDGIFLDEATGRKESSSSFRALADHIRSKDGDALVVLNPVQDLDEVYMSFVDIFVLFEYYYDAYRTKKLPDWVRDYPASRFVHIVYGVPNAKAAQKTLKLARQRNAGWVFVSHADPNVAYKSLGRYWDLQVRSACNAPLRSAAAA